MGYVKRLPIKFLQRAVEKVSNALREEHGPKGKKVCLTPSLPPSSGLIAGGPDSLLGRDGRTFPVAFVRESPSANESSQFLTACF